MSVSPSRLENLLLSIINWVISSFVEKCSFHMSHKGELYKAGLYDTRIFNFGISFGLVLAFTR